MRPGWVRRVALLGPPLVLGAAGVCAFGEASGKWEVGVLPLGPTSALVLVGLAVLSALGTLTASRARAAQAGRRGELRAAETRGDFLQAQNQELRNQIELLAAMREVTRVVTNDVDFERILEQVLRIVEGLLETRVITIYLADLSSAGLQPQAQRSAGATHFAGKIESDVLDTAQAHEVFHTQAVTRCAEDEELHLLLPLRADRECLGVLELSTALEGSREAKTAVADRLERQARDLSEHIAVAIKTSHLHDKAIIDGLTKLYTKRHFMEQLEASLNLARRFGKPFSLVLVDIDHFKKVNDTYGHLTGDHVLVGVAETMRRALRQYDAAFRYGGEELAMLLPETDVDGAAKLAERVRSRIANRTFKAEDGRKLTVTASFGVAMRQPDMSTPEQIIEAADGALYAAKERGRNRVVVVSPSAP